MTFTAAPPADTPGINSARSAIPRRPRWKIWRIPLPQVAIALVAINIVWRCVRYGMGFAIWGDEAYVAINFYTRDFTGLLKPLEYSQIVPLLFLWLEYLISRTLGMSEYALRLVPFLAGLASVWLYWRFVRRTLPRHFAIASLAVFAASYYPVRHAAEIKSYSVDMFVALVLLHLALNVRQRMYSSARWVWLGVALAVGVWLSYPAVFIGGGIMLVLGISALRTRSVPGIIGTAACGLALCASFAAMYGYFGSAQAADGHWLTELHSNWERTFPRLAQPWTLPRWFIDIHTGNLLAYPIGGNHYGSTATFILAVCGCIALWRLQRWLLMLLLSPLPLMFIAAALEKYPYGDSARVSQHVAPAACMLAGTGFVWLVRRLVSFRITVYVLRVGIGAMFLLALVGITIDVVRPYKKFSDAELKRAVIELARQSRPNDHWLIFGSPQATAFAPDYREWDGAGARLRFNIARFAPADVTWGADPAHIEWPQDGRLWFIVYRHSSAPFPEDMSEWVLESLIVRFGQPVERRDYPLRDPLNREVLWAYRFENKPGQ